MSTSPYNQAGNILTKILTQHKSIKSVTFQKNKLVCTKTTYAQICNTIQYKPLIDSILNHNHSNLKSKLQISNTRNIGLFYVLLYELLFGKFQRIKGGGQLKRLILEHEDELRHLKKVLMASSSSSSSSLSICQQKLPSFPRYLRVNTLKASTSEVVQILKQQLQKQAPNVDTSSILYVDRHVPDLLVLSPDISMTWHTNELVTSSKIILQDKSSCFSALSLIHGSKIPFPNLAKIQNHIGGDGSNRSCKAVPSSSTNRYDFIDACAAPGNKTSHLASLLSLILEKELLLQQQQQKDNNITLSGNVFAFDRSSSRIEILRKRLCQIVPSSAKTEYQKDNYPINKEMTHSKRKIHETSLNLVNTIPIHQDFLTVNPNDEMYTYVRGILLDPSCSGSGIVNTPDRFIDAVVHHDNNGGNEEEEENTNNNDGNAAGAETGSSSNKRIDSLSRFQLLALKHAMSFPQVERIVYSTCSVHEVENEKVVSCALEEGNKLISDSAMKWVLVAPYALNNWDRRGLNVHGLTVEQSKCLIRVNGLDGDETNGFFVSYFERQNLIDRYTQTNLNEEKTDTELVNLPPGVEAFYNGEFRQDVTLDIEQIEENIIPKNHDTNITASLENNTGSSSNIQKGKKVNVEKQLTVISAKKRKKLDWKKKQKELKAERLKKRESNPP